MLTIAGRPRKPGVRDGDAHTRKQKKHVKVYKILIYYIFRSIRVQVFIEHYIRPFFHDLLQYIVHQFYTQGVGAMRSLMNPAAFAVSASSSQQPGV